MQGLRENIAVRQCPHPLAEILASFFPKRRLTVLLWPITNQIARMTNIGIS